MTAVLHICVEEVYTLHCSVRSRGEADRLRGHVREGINHMAQGVLILGMTLGEEGWQYDASKTY
jgi:hypothetical protein